MKAYDVYGIGNALLDIDFEVSETTIQRSKIQKGVMTLIDEHTHHMLLEELDGVKHLKACGGSAANTLFTIQQLGGKTFYSCKVGNDEAGDYFYRDLILNGIHTNLHVTERDGVTGKCIVLVTPDADRTMNTFLGATATFSIAQLSKDALKKSEYLYIEGYLVASPTACEAALLARSWAEKYGVKTALTLSDPNMVNFFKKELCRVIGNTKLDILFANEIEALLFTETSQLSDAVEKLKDYARSFVVTRGSDGATVFDGQQLTSVNAYPAKVVDTVGAGDVFAGSFLYAITHGYDYVSAAKLASLVASRVVEKFGPRLSQEEMDAVVPKKMMECENQ